MQKANRYPRLNIGSKNELAKQISNKSFSKHKALQLINDVLENFDNYWYDSKKSQPDKGKFVRSAIGTPLNRLLKLINKKVLKPYDKLVPDFIFGGISGRNQIQAAYTLLGNQKKRTLLGLDISRFFEQIQKRRVFYFFNKKCGCSVRASRLLAQLCCVPRGKKGSGLKEITLARGFSTSSRLAVWTNIDTFLRLKWASSQILKGHDPKIVIFVDDIGISASKIPKQVIEKFNNKIHKLLTDFDKNQKLPVNEEKTKICTFETRPEHLGLHLGRNKITMSNKTKAKFKRVKNDLKHAGGAQKVQLVKKIKAYHRYQQQIKNVYQ